jgi:hypothetical protein
MYKPVDTLGCNTPSKGSEHKSTPFFSTTKVVKFGIPELDSMVYPAGVPLGCWTTIIDKSAVLSSKSGKALCHAYALEGCQSMNRGTASNEGLVPSVIYISWDEKSCLDSSLPSGNPRETSSKEVKTHEDSRELKIAWRYKIQQPIQQNSQDTKESDMNPKEILQRILWVNLHDFYSSDTDSNHDLWGIIDSFLKLGNRTTRIVIEDLFSPLFFEVSRTEKGQCLSIKFLAKLRQILSLYTDTTLLLYQYSYMIDSYHQTILEHYSDAHFYLRPGDILELSKPILIRSSMAQWLPITSHTQWQIQWKSQTTNCRKLTIQPCTLSSADVSDQATSQAEHNHSSPCSTVHLSF